MIHAIVPALQYASFSGIVGLVVYAIASGIPILIIAAFGGRVHTDMPHVSTLNGTQTSTYSVHSSIYLYTLQHPALCTQQEAAEAVQSGGCICLHVDTPHTAAVQSFVCQR